MIYSSTKKSINKKYWKDFSIDELDSFVDDIFSSYREQGFPYFPTDTQFRHKEYQKLKNFCFGDIFDKENKVVKQSMHGLSLAWSYMSHSWGVQCNDMITPLQAFTDDELFRKVIKKRLKFGDNISDNGIRKMLKRYSGVQAVSNFRPTAAAYIYRHFSDGGVTWDMSAGFGGRLVGSSLVDCHYIGTDPSIRSYNGLVNIRDDFNINAEIHCIGSEDFIPDKNSLDLCFTSPPYFDTEKYSNESTQSYIKYDTKEKWINRYLCSTFKNCHYGLKPNKHMIINIANVKSFKDIEQHMIDTARSVGFELVDEWKLALSSMQKGGYKYEPIFIFKKV